GRALGLSGAGGDGVDPHLPRGQFERQAAGQVVDGGLRGRVEGRLRPRRRAYDRADVDDAAAFGPEVFERLLDGQDWAADVVFIVPVDLPLRDRLERAELVAPRVVHEDVEPAEGPNPLGEQPLHVGGLRHVALNGDGLATPRGDLRHDAVRPRPVAGV